MLNSQKRSEKYVIEHKIAIKCYESIRMPIRGNFVVYSIGLFKASIAFSISLNLCLGPAFRLYMA